MIKLKQILIASTIFPFCFATIALAGDLLSVDRESALERTTEIEVTPQGVMIDLDSPISSVNISHKSEIVYQGVDGNLCFSRADCGDAPPPTILFVRKIPKIEFKDEEPMSDRTSMLYIKTQAGMFRFELNPLNKKPQYTEIQIKEPLAPLFPLSEN